MANNSNTTQAPAPPGGGAAAVPTYTGSSTGGSTTNADAPTTADALSSALAGKIFQVQSSDQTSNTFTETQQLLTLLGSLEKGTSFTGVPQSLVAQMLKAAGVKTGTSLTQARINTLKTTVADQITKNLASVGVVHDGPSPLKTVAQFQQLQVPGYALAKLKSAGYNVDNVTSAGTLLSNLSTQKVAANATGTLDGQSLYDEFQKTISTQAGAQQMASLLNDAGMSATPLSPTDPGGLLNAFQKAMGEAPASQDPFTYLQNTAKTNTASGIGVYQKPNSAYAYVQGLANTIGYPLTDSEINAIAEEYPDAGSSTADDTSIRQLVARTGAQTWQYDPNATIKGGSYLASVVNTIQDTAGQYAVNISPSVLTDIANNTLESGDLTSIYSATDAAMANSELHMKSMSSSLYPALAPLVKQGFNVQQIMDPYKQLASNTLGVASSAINLTDPQWASVLSSPTGELPSLDQFQATMMQDPRFGWQYSNDAATKYANMASTLVSTWGKVGGGPQPYANSVPSPTGG